MVRRSDAVRLGMFRGSVSELVHPEQGFCSMRRRLCTGCKGPAGVCSGSHLVCNSM